MTIRKNISIYKATMADAKFLQGRWGIKGFSALVRFLITTAAFKERRDEREYTSAIDQLMEIDIQHDKDEEATQ